MRAVRAARVGGRTRLAAASGLDQSRSCRAWVQDQRGSPVVAEIESSRARIAQTSRTKRPKQPRIPLLVGIGAVLAAPPVLADNWRITSSASATETYTSNVNYGSQGSNQGDFVTSVSGALHIDGVGPRARLNGTIAATGLLYAGQSEHNSIAPTVNLTGNVEAIEKFFYIDAQADRKSVV